MSRPIGHFALIFVALLPTPILAEPKPPLSSRTQPELPFFNRESPIPFQGFVTRAAMSDEAIWVGQLNKTIKNQTEPDFLCRVDPRTHRVTARVSLPSIHEIVAGAGFVWVATFYPSGDPRSSSSSIRQFDEQTLRQTAIIPLSGSETCMAFGDGSLWYYRDENRNPLTNWYHGKRPSHHAVRVDPHTNQEIAHIPLDGSVSRMVVGEGSIWAIYDGIVGTPMLYRIDTQTNKLVASVLLSVSLQGNRVHAIAVGEGSVWIVQSTYPPYNIHNIAYGAKYHLLRFDPHTNAPVGAPIFLFQEPRYPGFTLGVDHGSVWVMNTRWAPTVKIDCRTGERVDYPVSLALPKVTAGVHGVWVTWGSDRQGLLNQLEP